MRLLLLTLMLGIATACSPLSLVDIEKTSLYELAASGNPRSQYEVALLYMAKGDSQKFMEWIDQAQQNDYPPAYSMVAAAYTDKENRYLPYNPEKARTLAQKGADRNDPIGYIVLGDIYLHGMGVESDDNKAFTYYKKAAESSFDKEFHHPNHPLLLKNYTRLAVMYYTGRGTKRSYQSALKWDTVATHYGHQPSIQRLKTSYKGLIDEKSANSAIEEAKQLMYEQ